MYIVKRIANTTSMYMILSLNLNGNKKMFIITLYTSTSRGTQYAFDMTVAEIQLKKRLFV
jgi:hypothetical protein